VIRESSKLSEAQPSASLSARSQAFLLNGLRASSTHSLALPAVMHVLALAGGLTWLGRFVLVVALARECRSPHSTAAAINILLRSRSSG